MDKLRELFSGAIDWTVTGGPVKTSSFAMGGLISAASVRGVLEWIILVGTAVIVTVHVVNVLMRQYCPFRRWGKREKCKACHFLGSAFCPIKIKDAEETTTT